MIIASICASDIPKDAITVSEKNGKKYFSIVIDEKKQKDNYGNTHAVSINQSKEQRDAKAPKVYVGNGKEFVFTKKVDTSYEQLPDEESPF